MVWYLDRIDAFYQQTEIPLKVESQITSWITWFLYVEIQHVEGHGIFLLLQVLSLETKPRNFEITWTSF